MIKTVFFDLDWCILNSETVYKMYDPVRKVIEDSDIPEEIKEKYRISFRGHTDIDAIKEFSDELVQKIRSTYDSIDVPDDIKSYGDEDCIKELPTTNFLITTGFRVLPPVTQPFKEYFQNRTKERQRRW